MLIPSNASSLLRKLLQLPLIRILLVSTALWLVAFAYAKHRFWRDPHSAFFSSDGVYDLHYSKDRQVQAQAYISKASEPSAVLHKANRPEYCAAFVTVRREGIQYVDEAVASLLEGLNDEERGALSVQLLFADTDAKKHPSWESKWLHDAVDGMIGYNVTDETMTTLIEWEAKRDFYRKGVFDYLYALRACYDTGASYVLMFEDDIIAMDGWFVKVRQAVKIIASKSQTPTDEFWDWIYLRLFYTETSIEYNEADFWYHHMFITFVLVGGAGFLCLMILRENSTRAKLHLNNLSLFTICAVVIPAFVALFFMCGKYSIIPPSTVFTLNKYGCCTQGLLFPRAQIPDLIRYLDEKQFGQTDTLLEDYADRDGLQRLATRRQLIQHIGLVSSRDNTLVNSQSTWAFWFETNEVEKLRREKEYLRERLHVM